MSVGPGAGLGLGRGLLSTALTGVTVLDASRVLAGPFAGQVLADLGAEVIKVEPPGGGDETRGWGPPFVGQEAEGLSAYFLAANRGKRSMVIDLKHAEGRALFRRLAAVSDIVLENWRADSVKTLGLTAADLHSINSKLIICSLSGFGRDGADAARPGYDFVVQGLSGLMAMTGAPGGEPAKVGVAIVDVITGLYAATAVLAGLRGRQESGHGYAIELALLDCAAAATVNIGQSFLTSGQVPKRQGNAHAQIVPYQLFATQDGYLVVAVGNDAQWQRFCVAAEQESLAADPRWRRNADRVRQRQDLLALLQPIMRARSNADWQARLSAASVPCGPVWDVGQFFTSDLAANRHLVIKAQRPDGTPVDLIRSPLVEHAALPPLPPPCLGEHTAEILAAKLGLSLGEIQALRASGALG